MATIQEIAEALGEEAQVCGGSIVVYRDGVHVLVAQTTELGFEVTKQGQALLDETVVSENGSTVILAKPKKAKKVAEEIPVEEALVEEVPVEEAPYNPLVGL